MADACCSPGEIHSARRRRVLWAVLGINAVMFVAGSMQARVRAAQLKGVIMLGFGIAVFVQVVLKVLYGVAPEPLIVSWTAAAALAANLVCLGLLVRHRSDDINMRSTWICSRNDIFANSGVLISAAAVALSASIWPDVIVSLMIVALFLWSAAGVLREAAATSTVQL